MPNNEVSLTQYKMVTESTENFFMHSVICVTNKEGLSCI
jgi:hypothetical protein